MPLPQSSRSVQPTPALIPRPPIVPPPMPPAPVTSNRRRYRCDSDDEDDEEEQELLHKKARAEKSLAKIIEEKGKGFTIFYDMFRDIDVIIEWGATFDQDSESLDEIDSIRKKFILLWQDLVQMAPTLLDVIREKGLSLGLSYISQHLLRGRLDVRRAHTHSVKQAIGSWCSFNPSLTADKATRGFHHPDCGRLLCPAIYDWDDSVVRDGILSHNPAYRVIAQNYPLFLWRDSMYDPNNPFIGFLRSALLVKALRHIAISPSSADSGGNRSSKKGYAALNGITKVTIPAIAYSAVMVYFALSSDENFSENGGGARRFSHRQFYLGLIGTVQLWSDDDRDTLLSWWNREVFMHSGESQEPMVNDPNTLEARLRRIARENN